jgi:hypothetical protein
MNFEDHEDHVCEFQNWALWKIFGQCKSSGAHPSASQPLASAFLHRCAFVTIVNTRAEPCCSLEGASHPMEGSPPSSSLSFKAPRSFLALSSQIFLSKASSGAVLGRLHHPTPSNGLGAQEPAISSATHCGLSFVPVSSRAVQSPSRRVPLGRPPASVVAARP